MRRKAGAFVGLEHVISPAVVGGDCEIRLHVGFVHEGIRWTGAAVYGVVLVLMAESVLVASVEIRCPARVGVIGIDHLGLGQVGIPCAKRQRCIADRSVLQLV